MKKAFNLSGLGVVVLLLTFGCKDDGNTGNTEPRAVKLVTPTIDKGEVNFEFNGEVSESLKAGIAFRVGGPVTGIFAEEGDFVQAGDLMASIDPRDFQVGLSAAEAQLNQSRAEYERYHQLFNQGKLPANSYEKMKTAFVAAQSNWEKAKNALADTRLLAPFSGYIFKKDINRHETIAPGYPVYTIINLNELEVAFGVPETMIGQMNAQIIANVDIAGLEVPASVKSIAGKAGDNNLYEVKLSVKNPDFNRIKPGMSAKVHITINNHLANLPFILPVEAVFYRQQQPYVWIFNETSGTVSSREVITGNLCSAGQIEIRQGLTGSEQVISAGVNSLFEGQRVNVKSQNKSL